MEVDFAFACDYADLSGKIHALGIGFDTIFAREVPARHPIFYVVAQLRSSVAEAGVKEFEFRLIDPDGTDVIKPLKGSFEVPAPAGVTETKGRIGMAFHNVRFPRYGHYSLHLVVQGREMVRLPLRVAPQPQPPQQQE